MLNFKNIHIGRMIENRVTEIGIGILRICNFFKCTEKEIQVMYSSQSIDTEILLKWSRLLEYDFFRMYSQHLILYAPPSSTNERVRTQKTNLPRFRKNIYTQEVIDFILEQVATGEMTKKEVIEQYRIPKTTLYKWIIKYKPQD